MILIGDPHIPYESITRVDSKEDITKTEPNTTVVFEMNMELLSYCTGNSLHCGVIAKNTLEVIYAHNLGARYIIVPKELAKQMQELADNYMFDSKILAIISNTDEIAVCAEQHIDGIIYEDILG